MSNSIKTSPKSNIPSKPSTERVFGSSSCSNSKNKSQGRRIIKRSNSNVQKSQTPRIKKRFVSSKKIVKSHGYQTSDEIPKTADPRQRESFTIESLVKDGLKIQDRVEVDGILAHQDPLSDGEFTHEGMSIAFQKLNSKKMQNDNSYPTYCTHYSDRGCQNQGGVVKSTNFCFDINLDLIGEEKESIRSSPPSSGRLKNSLKRIKSHDDFTKDSKSFLFPSPQTSGRISNPVTNRRTDALSKIKIMQEWLVKLKQEAENQIKDTVESKILQLFDTFEQILLSHDHSKQIQTNQDNLRLQKNNEINFIEQQYDQISERISQLTQKVRTQLGIQQNQSYDLVSQTNNDISLLENTLSNSHILKKLLQIRSEALLKKEAPKPKITVNLSKLDEIENDIFKSDFKNFRDHRDSLKSSLVESQRLSLVVKKKEPEVKQCCPGCKYNFETKTAGGQEKPSGLWDKVFNSRKEIKCNKCLEMFCQKCCDNKWYAPTFKDQKVAMCDGCFDSAIQLQVKKKHQILKNSVFKSDFLITNLERNLMLQVKMAKEKRQREIDYMKYEEYHRAKIDEYNARFQRQNQT